MDAGADIVELDVRRTADGELVVIHDPTIASDAVAELTAARIRDLQPQIPTLDEALEQLRGRVALEVEIKNDPDEAGYEPAASGIAYDVATALRRHACIDAFVASFDPECLRSFQKNDPEVRTGLLVAPSDPLIRALEKAAAGGHAFLLPEASALVRAGRSFIDGVHEREMRVCTWTVNDAEQIERLFDLGVDAVETDNPALGVAIRDRFRQRT